MKKTLALIITVLACSLPARAADPMAGADDRIRQVRTRLVEVRVRDGQGRPVAGRFQVEMVRHQFLFGCNFFLFNSFTDPKEEERYRELYRGLFNYATVPFYLATYEPERGRTREALVRDMARWCVGQGIKVKGHPLVWHYSAGNPAWLQDDPATVEAVHRERILELVRKFAPEIEYWDVLNEPTVCWMYNTPVAYWERRIGIREATRRALAWAREANPAAKLLVNDYNVKGGAWSFMDLLFPALNFMTAVDRHPNYKHSFYQFMADLKRDGGGYDAVGIQSHMHMGGNWTMAETWSVCESYARLGVPVHFTELTVLSGVQKIMRPDNPAANLPWPSTPEGEAFQAEYVERFYTLLFSHPAVGAITWWDFSDRNSWMGAPAGLLRADLSPKPAYARLVELVRKKWWTSLSAESDGEGRISFRGFCGDYQLTLPDGRALPFVVDCRQSGTVEASLSL